MALSNKVPVKVGNEISGAVETLEAIAARKNYPWLGNIRELQNAIERLCVTCDLKIDEELVVDTLDEDADDNMQGTERIDCLRKKHIFEVLKQCGNNKKLAAEKLGISRTTLWREVKGNNKPLPG